VQASALVLLLGAATYAVLLNRVKAIEISTTEIVMYVVGVVYVVLGVFHEEDAVISSIAFLTAIILISIISRTISLDRFLDIGAGVALMCVLTSIAVDHTAALAGLSASVGRTGLARFTPLSNGPNLTGYTFGAGSILLIRRSIVSKNNLERAVMAIAAIVSGVFVLAASARASLIALFAAALFALVAEIGLGRVFSSKWVKIGAVVFAIVGLVFSEKLFSYFTKILELDSNTRGVGTGGTGRTTLWARGVAALFDDPITFAVGGGFRSSAADLIGFSTESSYITILLDSGVFFGAAVILVFWYAPVKALKLSVPQQRHSSSLVLLASFLAFLVIESFFNRYLLAIGNPMSLMSLLIVFSLSIRGILSGSSSIRKPSP